MFDRMNREESSKNKNGKFNKIEKKNKNKHVNKTEKMIILQLYCVANALSSILGEHVDQSIMNS